MNEPFLRRLRIRNYKSIGRCDVRFGKLNLLVGRNGSGKSNCLDALRFVLDSLQYSLDHAIRMRGGIEEVRRRSTGHPHNFGLELTISLSASQTAIYGFEVASQKPSAFAVKVERLKIQNARGDVEAEFKVESGEVKRASLAPMPPVLSDRLYLVNAAGLPMFRPVYDALSAMGFYCLNPEQMKEIQTPDKEELLRRDGSNLASVVARLEAHPELKARVQEYLAAIVGDIADFKRISLGPRPIP